MPATDISTHPDEKDRDRDRDNERNERGVPRQKSTASSTSKSSKDLSHVPCKFFKVGGCTAGSSCPFSHNLVEPGGQKETCAWFVKGTCKFGHKCALAHILPGQSMAMDRKNKKAAQLAAAAANGGASNERSERPGKEGRGGGRVNNQKRDGQIPSGTTAGGSNRNPLLAGGSTAPTRMPLKASLSPSAPAPPLASFGVLGDLDAAGVQLATAPAQGKHGSQDSIDNSSDTPIQESKFKPSSSPAPLPTSAPRPGAQSAKPQHDFGPIGSPPATSLQSHAKLNPNGSASPGASPQHINGITIVPDSPNNNNANDTLSTSPFSAPGTQSVFGSSFHTAGGIATSLGSGLAMMGGRKGWGANTSNGGGPGGESGSLTPSSLHQRLNDSGRGAGSYDIGLEYDDYNSRRALGLGLGGGGGRAPANSGGRALDIAVDDEDLEDFLPSSLNDLLTPEERSRRMSRSNSGQGPATALGATGPSAGEPTNNLNTGSGGNSGLGHRYSRSVPAPSLLGDIKSIWADNTTNAHPMPSSPPTHRGTPSSSFASRLDSTLGMRNHVGNSVDDGGLSMSIGSAGSSGMMNLSPSNASAAFLPGLHSQYLTSKARQAQVQQLGLGALGRGVRGTSGPIYTASGTTGSTLTNNYLFGGGSALSPSSNSTLHTQQHTYRAPPSPFDLTQQTHLQTHLQPHAHTARPIPSNTNIGAGPTHADDPHHGTHLLSPSTRALQSHAPGQSLPQGLAAGYSRIHALPPPPSLASPGSASAFGGSTPPSVGFGFGLDPGPGTNVSANINTGNPGGGPYGGWKGTNTNTSINVTSVLPPGTTATTTPSSGLDSIFSRLSYSAAAASRTSAPTNTNTSGGITPPGLTRNVSGGRYPSQQGPSSPLSRENDDDDLFSMDG